MESADDRTSWDLSQRNHTPDTTPLIWTLPSPQFPALLTSDNPVTPEREVKHSSRHDCSRTSTSLASRDHVHVPSSRIVDLPLPVFPRIALPRSSLSSSGIHDMLERRFASSEPGNDHSNTEVDSAAPNPLLDGLLSSAQNGEFHSTLDFQDARRPSPASPSVLLLEAQPSRTTQLDSLPLSIPAHLEDCGRPTAVLESRHKGIDLEAGTSSGRTALESRSSRLRTSVDQVTSMRACRRPRVPVPQSSKVASARSDLAPETFFSSSDDFPITTRRSSGLPLSQVSNLPDVSLVRKDAKTQAVKRIPKLMPRPPLSRLVPELQDQAFIHSDIASLDEDDPPCASGKVRKGRRTNDYRISSRPHDTSRPDCSFPGDSGEHVRLRIIAALTDVDIGSLYLWARCSRRAGLRF
jgi:hypothetical protein